MISDLFSGMEVWKKMSKTQADVTALKPMAPSESELHFYVFIAISSTWTAFSR